ncbi:MAG: hypothetical protein KH415_17900 [Clostridium sp.]|nr:hypothetical protein [Clostridium sp.]
MKIEKIKEILKNKKVQVVSGAVVGALIIAIAGTMILSNKGKVDNGNQIVVATDKEDKGEVEKQLKAQLEKLKKTDISKLSEEERKAIEEQTLKIEELINKKEYDKVKTDIVNLRKEIEKKIIKSENKSEDKKEETIKEEVKDKEDKKEESNKEVVLNSAGNNTSSNEIKNNNNDTNTNKNNGQSSSNNNASNGSTHTHSWNPITEQVHHDEVGHWEDVVVTPAWTEEIPVYEEQYRAICNTCGADITGSEAAHVRNHMLNGENGSYRNEPTKVQVGTNNVNHPAVTEKKWVIDKAAWTETVTVGHSCSCGATK